MSEEKKKIVLGVSGSVAAYKACEVASALTQKDCDVHVAMTPSAAKLISPVLFRAITGKEAIVDEFSGDTPTSMTHIDFAGCDLFLVAPASANIIGKMAQGIGDDLVSTTALALPTSTPKMFAPAMNSNMYENPLVKRNIETLQEVGFEMIEPDAGHLACGVQGMGRLASPETIVQNVLRRMI